MHGMQGAGGTFPDPLGEGRSRSRSQCLPSGSTLAKVLGFLRSKSLTSALAIATLQHPMSLTS
ncbi:hypothetical protein [Phormidium sp. CCY1219]|uniref:hypothetical protein n=1 Tax=Phormidium sp. CCY1219 TaxID=2886104 RepID=UPI002D1EDF87|nr:hypothetical protein [Phormidium sp. CCY1219]MEB3826759.1 hypothetical protein [Phormidium sp. CCY1219]